MAWLPNSRKPATLPYQSHPGHLHSLPSSKENEVVTEVLQSTRTKLVTPICRILFQGGVSSCFGFIRHVSSSKDSKEWHERLLVHILYYLVLEPSAMTHRQHPFNPCDELCTPVCLSTQHCGSLPTACCRGRPC